MSMNGIPEHAGYYIEIYKYIQPIERLVSSLDEYERQKNTYEEPEKFLEMLLSSVATQINDEIKRNKTENKK